MERISFAFTADFLGESEGAAAMKREYIHGECEIEEAGVLKHNTVRYLS
jgi:hypothetical protein